jgi:hypothetical protein
MPLKRQLEEPAKRGRLQHLQHLPGAQAPTVCAPPPNLLRRILARAPVRASAAAIFFWGGELKQNSIFL